MKKNIILLALASLMSLSLSAQGSKCGDKMKDIDGNAYNTVQIGDQCWMKENMRAIHDAEGKEIAMGSSANYNILYRYAPNDNLSNVDKYGYLYNYVAAKSICPEGWRLPTEDEFESLKSSAGSHREAGSYANFINKSQKANDDWKTTGKNNSVGNNLSTENASKFSALPAGGYVEYYRYFGDNALFWSVTINGSNGAYAFSINMESKVAQTLSSYRSSAFSVRCVKNE